MLGFAALLIATASANISPALDSSSPWWERFTFTMSDDGEQQACRYETSLPSIPGDPCAEDSSAGRKTDASTRTSSAFTKITIERRFTPGLQPDRIQLQTGDTLLGGRIMALAIDTAGAVQSCEIVGTSGKLMPPYGCDDIRSERFEAKADMQRGFMTVLVYGHEEYPV